MIKVYHLDWDKARVEPKDVALDLPPFEEVIFGFKNDGRQEIAAVNYFKKECYEHVANVETNDLDTAWEMTNHIFASWTQNDGVEVLTTRARSSSVGDLFEDENGAFHVCSSIGFKPVNITAQSTAESAVKKPRP
jgi:hypothetical protein